MVRRLTTSIAAALFGLALLAAPAGADGGPTTMVICLPMDIICIS